MHLRKTIAIALVATAAVIAAGTALATQGAGVAGVVHARGTLGDHFKLKLRNSSNPGDAIVQQLTIAPGGHTGWHTHPGPAWVIVTQGTVTYYDAACNAHAYPAGSALFDVGTLTHTARNEGGEPLEIIATFMFPTHAEAVSIPQPAPASCPIEA